MTLGFYTETCTEPVNLAPVREQLADPEVRLSSTVDWALRGPRGPRSNSTLRLTLIFRRSEQKGATTYCFLDPNWFLLSSARVLTIWHL